MLHIIKKLFASKENILLECPYCHFQNTLKLSFKQNIVEGEYRLRLEIVYYGKIVKEYYCLNCNKTHHESTEEKWYNKKPANLGK